MTKPVVVLLSRQGRHSVDPRSWSMLTRLATVQAVRLDAAPDRRRAITLLRESDLVGATNLCLPAIDATLLDELPQLRGLVLYATGYDHIDVSLLRERGVGLSVLPDYATVAVAEHCIAMLMALATRLHLAHDRSRGQAPATTSLRGTELAGRTLGIIGVGRIGRRVARLATALGMRVVGTDIDAKAVARASASGVAMGDLDWLLAQSDAVAVCASHTFGTPPIVSESQIARLPPDALLINVARPALVSTAAVTAALRAGQLRGYAVDDVVLDANADDDLLCTGRVLQTGHSAWWRDEVLQRGAAMWGERLVAAVRGEPLDAVTWPAAATSAQPVRTSA